MLITANTEGATMAGQEPPGEISMDLARANLTVPAGSEPDDLVIGKSGARARWRAGADRYVTVRLMLSTTGWIVVPLGSVCHGSLSLLTKATTWAAAMVAALEASRVGEPRRTPTA